MRGGTNVTVVTATELWLMSASQLADAIRSKGASSREVVEAHLRRIEEIDPTIHAVVIVLGVMDVARHGSKPRQSEHRFGEHGSLVAASRGSLRPA
jgi:Asp-tRNA(Asn)/Glu-tRNA(Gln) amidotransferase A subunit family amidase